MTEVQMVKCACSDCVCVIDPDDAVEQDGRYYCSETCADGHRDDIGCGHVGCACHG